VSVKVVSAVWEHSRTEGVTRLIFIALADHCDHDGLAWPSIERVAEKCRVSVRTVQRAYKDIELMGEMVRTIRPGRTRTNLYQVVLPGCGEHPEKVTESHLLAPEKVTNRAEKVTEQVVKGDTVVTRTIRNRQLNRASAEITPVDKLGEYVDEIRRAMSEHPTNGQRDGRD
jgi:hypothetical protein